MLLGIDAIIHWIPPDSGGMCTIVQVFSRLEGLSWNQRNATKLMREKKRPRQRSHNRNVSVLSHYC